MYLLRRHFGISAHEAWHVLPAWEIDVLLDQLALEAQAAGEYDEPHNAPSEGRLTMTGEVE